MSGRVGDLSEKQQAALDEFKRVCSDLLTEEWHDDHFCLRWLRARSFNTEAAKTMLEKSVDFRRRYRLDHILTEFKPNVAIQKIFPGGCCGFDREGGCVMVYPLQNIFPKYFLEMTRRSQVIKMLMYRMELTIPLLRSQSKKYGRNIEAHTIIFDVDKFDIMHNISTVAISVFMELVGTYEANYPENLAHAIIINAPPIFYLFFNLLKPLLNGTTLAKVKIYGKDPAEWKPALLEIVEPSNLPVRYGGNRVGPNSDPDCEHEIVYVRKLNSEIVRELQKLIPEEDRMHQVTVGRRSQSVVPMEVSEIGAGLHVEFESECHDIAFALLRYTPGKEENEVILPSKRYNSHHGPVVLCVRCALPGRYLLQFDNSYSSLRAKNVSLNTTIIPASKLNDDMLFVHEP